MKYLSSILLIVLLVSCGGEGKKRVKKPDDLIPKDKMVEVIYDMSLLSAAKGVNRKILEQQGVHPEIYVYEKHNIDSTQFAQSNEYYAFDLDVYAKIYENVKLKLEKDKKHYSDIVRDKETLKDSTIKERRKEEKQLKP